MVVLLHLVKSNTNNCSYISNSKGLEPIKIISRLQGRGESAIFALFVELGNPFIWTERVICLSELFAWGVVLALGSYTFEVISVILEAISGLVGIWETSVKSYGL